MHCDTQSVSDLPYTLLRVMRNVGPDLTDVWSGGRQRLPWQVRSLSFRYRLFAGGDPSAAQ